MIFFVGFSLMLWGVLLFVGVVLFCILGDVGEGVGSVFSVFFPVFSWLCPEMLCASSGFKCLG